MPARDVLDFMIRTEAILFKAVWHLRTPYDEAHTHYVYCELRQGDVVQARAAIAAVNMDGGIGEKWHLLPDRP
ncbi:hypothetical protein [Paraburkholderia aspalathi]|uniref:hypothetical protein n=1 Tax=Paraburkholderia aspalathi TaxID=1324617 RepID=UPI0038BDB61A